MKKIENKALSHDLNNTMPLLMTVSQMSQVCGIGINKLREMIENNEIEYVEIGNRKLLAVEAIWNWYQKTKITSCN
jgi:excisionase family DNA binding protein